MKNRVFITLLLSTAVALPAVAQQSNSGSSAPAAVSSGQTTSTSQPATAAIDQPLPPDSHGDFWDGEQPSFGALIFHPFATKEYVRRHLQPIRDRLSELDELTESNRKMIRDVDTRAQHGIQLASEKVNLADEHAQDAITKAQTAHETAAAVDNRLGKDETVVANIDQYKSGTQTEIRFRPGQTVLSKEAKDALDAMASPLKNQHGYIIEVQGFSSGQGQAAIANSRKMAESVVRYLVANHEIPTYRIYAIGVGNASGAKGTGGMRVEVNLLKNDVEQIAQQ
jgi:outer membrane protein OmpA-like peptidoglycan-associated protein